MRMELRSNVHGGPGEGERATRIPLVPHPAQLAEHPERRLRARRPNALAAEQVEENPQVSRGVKRQLVTPLTRRVLFSVIFS